LVVGYRDGGKQDADSRVGARARDEAAKKRRRGELGGENRNEHVVGHRTDDDSWRTDMYEVALITGRGRLAV
jgi:hypothetical protein